MKLSLHTIELNHPRWLTAGDRQPHPRHAPHLCKQNSVRLLQKVKSMDLTLRSAELEVTNCDFKISLMERLVSQNVIPVLEDK